MLDFMVQFLLQVVNAHQVCTIQQMLQFVIPLDVLPQRLLVCEGLAIRAARAVQGGLHLPTTGLHMGQAGACAQAKTLANGRGIVVPLLIQEGGKRRNIKTLHNIGIIETSLCLTSPKALFFGVNLLGTFEFMPACNIYELLQIPNASESYLMSESKSFPDGPSDGVTHRVPA